MRYINVEPMSEVWPKGKEIDENGYADDEIFNDDKV